MVNPNPADVKQQSNTSNRLARVGQEAKPQVANETIPLSPEMATVESSLNDLACYLQKTIAGNVHIGETIADSLTLKKAIETYSEHLSRIRELRGEWTTFLAQFVAIEGQKSGKDKYDVLDAQLQAEVETWRLELLNTILRTNGLEGSIEDSIVTAKLSSEPLDKVKATLESHIDDSIARVSILIQAQLIKLVELEVISIIEWFGDDTCTFKRFTRGLTARCKGENEKTRRIWWTNEGWKKTVRNSIYCEASRTLSCRIQHLVNAKSYQLGESKVLVPREQTNFIALIPGWLSPAARIVEGILIRETLIEQDICVHKWEMTHDTIQWHDDPAVILGPFVLSAWGPTEIQAELAKQEADLKRLAAESRTQNRPMTPVRVVGVISTVLAGVFCMARQNATINPVVGMLLAALAFILLGHRWQQELPKAIEENPAPEDAFGYAGMIVGSVVLSSFLLSFGRVVEGIGGVLFAILSLKLYCNATYFWNPIAESSDKAS